MKLKYASFLLKTLVIGGLFSAPLPVRAQLSGFKVPQLHLQQEIVQQETVPQADGNSDAPQAQTPYEQRTPGVKFIPVPENKPDMQAAVTQAPVTQAPVAQISAQEVQAPDEQASITQAPVTQAPIAQAPVAQISAQDASVAQAPVMQVNAQAAPVTQAPVTQAPVAQVSAQDAPAVTEAPATKGVPVPQAKPDMQSPHEGDGSNNQTQAPVENGGVVAQPAPEQPAVAPPTTETAKPPANVKPVNAQPVSAEQNTPAVSQEGANVNKAAVQTPPSHPQSARLFKVVPFWQDIPLVSKGAVWQDDANGQNASILYGNLLSFDFSPPEDASVSTSPAQPTKAPEQSSAQRNVTAAPKGDAPQNPVIQKNPVSQPAVSQPPGSQAPASQAPVPQNSQIPPAVQKQPAQNQQASKQPMVEEEGGRQNIGIKPGEHVVPGKAVKQQIDPDSEIRIGGPGSVIVFILTMRKNSILRAYLAQQDSGVLQNNTAQKNTVSAGNQAFQQTKPVSKSTLPPQSHEQNTPRSFSQAQPSSQPSSSQNTSVLLAEKSAFPSPRKANAGAHPATGNNQAAAKAPVASAPAGQAPGVSANSGAPYRQGLPAKSPVTENYGTGNDQIADAIDKIVDERNAVLKMEAGRTDIFRFVSAGRDGHTLVYQAAAPHLLSSPEWEGLGLTMIMCREKRLRPLILEGGAAIKLNLDIKTPQSQYTFLSDAQSCLQLTPPEDSQAQATDEPDFIALAFTAEAARLQTQGCVKAERDEQSQGCTFGMMPNTPFSWKLQSVETSGREVSLTFTSMDPVDAADIKRVSDRTCNKPDIYSVLNLGAVYHINVKTKPAQSFSISKESCLQR